jgi:Uri superfamily endonuclease
MPGSARGTYVLLLDLGRPFESVIGRLGVVSLAPGRYAYVGSAHGPGGLAARLGRHLRRPERVHWHVDHLRDTATPAGWLWAEGEMRLECRWAQALLALAGGAAPVRGFGASDCAQGCAAHLVLLPSGARENDVLAALDAATPGGIVVRRSILGG